VAFEAHLQGKARFIKKHVFCQCKSCDVKNHAFRKTATFSAAIGELMAAASRATKHIIKAHKALRQAAEITQQKLDALLATNALYKLFEHDEKHPYYALADAGSQALKKFELLVAGVMDWLDGGSTIGEELDKAKARQVVDGTEADTDLDALRLLQPNLVSVADAAKLLLSVYQSALVAESWSSAAATKFALAEMHGKRNITKHQETPEVKVATECRTALRELKKLCKVLRDYGYDGSTVGKELERQQVMRGLTGHSKDMSIETLLAL